MAIVSSCSKMTELTAKEWLFFIQTIMIAVMTIFMVQFRSVFSEKQPVAIAPVLKPCFSLPQMEPIQKKFRLYKDLVFYSIIASAITNLTLIAFEYKLEVKTIMKTMVYGPIMAVGIMVMALSVDGFLKIQSMSNKPLECKDLLEKFRIFFILAMSIGVAQAVFAMYVLKGMYFKSI